MTKDEVTTIARYAKKHGRNWKQQLLQDWQEGRTSGTLQAIRNSLGPVWLATYRVSD